MKDDLASMRSPGRPTVQVQPVAPKPAPFTPSVPQASAPTPSLPMAPLNPMSGKSVVLPAEAPKRGAKGILSILIVIVALILGAGAAWYFLFFSSTNTAPTGEVAKPVKEMLPETAIAITEYQLNETTIPKIKQLFSKQREAQPTFDTLLGGDPRLASQYPDVKEVYYVQLPGDPRAYLLSPETASLKKLFENTSASQTIVQGGWRIAHPVNVANFTAALIQGTMATQEPPALTAFTSSYGMRVYVSAEALTADIAKGAGISVTDTGVRAVNAKSDVNITGGNLLQFDGILTSATAQGSVSRQDPALLSLVPADAQFVYAGNDLGADIDTWASLQTSLLASEITSQPQLKQILLSLSAAPYVFYRESSPLDTTPRFGIIIKLTPQLVKSFTDDRVGLENTLFALRPLITGSTTPLPTLPLFADGVYDGLPLRYANINGPAQAIDYTIADPYLVIATSKDGMFATLDVLTKKVLGLLDQNASLVQAKSSILSNSAIQKVLIMPAKESGVLGHALPGLVSAENALLTILSSPLNGGETQSISGLLAF